MSFNNKNMLHTCHPIICPIYSFTEMCRSYDTFITFQHKKKRAENCLILVRKVIWSVHIIKCQPIQIKQMYCTLCPVLISSSLLPTLYMIWIIHIVGTLLWFLVFATGWSYKYSLGLLRRQCGNHTIVPVSVRQLWQIQLNYIDWINKMYIA